MMKNPTLASSHPGPAHRVILEGADCTGKSHLAAELSEHYNNRGWATYVCFHDVALKLNSRDLAKSYAADLLSWLLRTSDGIPKAMIIDRTWISEFVYGSVYRGHIRLTDKQEALLIQIAAAADARVVYCSPPLDAVRAAFEDPEREEYLPSFDKLKLVYHTYAAYMATLAMESALPVYKYDYTACTIDQLTRLLDQPPIIGELTDVTAMYQIVRETQA